MAGIALVIHCTGGGLANADMEMLFFIISTLKNYFPKGFSYLLVHELPWILKPFWHIAKAWVSEEHRQLVKFSDSQTIFEYVAGENLPDFMGGTCRRDYRAVPENCTTLEQAIKLWGMEREVVRKALYKFSENLPPEVIERFEASSSPWEECSESSEDSLDSGTVRDQPTPSAYSFQTPLALELMRDVSQKVQN